MQENKAGKTKEKGGKKGHQGQETREVGKKGTLPLNKTITLIPAMMDQTRVEGEKEGVTQAGGQREESLSTDKSR